MKRSEPTTTAEIRIDGRLVGQIIGSGAVTPDGERRSFVDADEKRRGRASVRVALPWIATSDCPKCHGVSTVDPDPDCDVCGGEGQIETAASGNRDSTRTSLRFGIAERGRWRDRGFYISVYLGRWICEFGVGPRGGV